MRKLMFSIGMLTIAVIIFTSCQKKNESLNVPSAELVNEQKSMSLAYNNAKNYNDTIGMYHNLDSTMMNGMCQHFDSLYHQNDSLFTIHYNKCMQMMSNGNMMSDNNMMSGNNGSGGMMGNGSNSQGMMGGNGTSGNMMSGNCGNGMNSTTMLENMNGIRAKHQKYHQ